MTSSYWAAFQQPSSVLRWGILPAGLAPPNAEWDWLQMGALYLVNYHLVGSWTLSSLSLTKNSPFPLPNASDRPGEGRLRCKMA